MEEVKTNNKDHQLFHNIISHLNHTQSVSYIIPFFFVLIQSVAQGYEESPLNRITLI